MFEPQKEQLEVWKYSSAEEHLPSTCEALGSIPKADGQTDRKTERKKSKSPLWGKAEKGGSYQVAGIVFF